jgi:copper chaperone CopZ
MNKTLEIKAPAMYGDHHVVEVRRLLLELPGVQEVYASSAFHTIEITFDTDLVSEETILKTLGDSGYLDELVFPTESGTAAYLEQGKPQPFFRHTEVYETSRQTVSFSQNVAYLGRPLWNCPGFGVIRKMEEE